MTSVPWKKLITKISPRVQLAPKVFYEVVWTDGFQREDVLGETRFDPPQIAIKTGQSDKETVKTYLHELLHSISEEYDVGLTEKQVQALEKALPYVLKPGNVFKD